MSSEQQHLQKQPQEQPSQQPEPPPTPAPVPKTFLRYSNTPDKDFFDTFRNEKICTIPATSHVKKQDTFLAMRPKQGTCMDYRISETDTKLDAGMTRIHIRQVNATYEPLPPKEPEEEAPPSAKKRKRNPSHNKYCHAREPVYKFAEERYERRIMKEQEFFKNKLKERIARLKYDKLLKKSAEHGFMLEFCGPDWFIELSPVQKETIDNLNEAIKHDLKFDEVTETCHIISRLGIVLRPNRKLVEVALKNCCKCPVEFLLTLYQLMNPHRTSYSLNDMLILSSVVHLTLKNTLKEMHIRLPSPPPPLEPSLVKSKRPKKCTYDSPYLKPCIFIRPKPTSLENWKNRHLIFPKNPYFAYIKEINELRHPTFTARSRLRMSKEKISNAPETATLQNELLAAQAAFNQTHNYYEYDTVHLLRASIYNTCNKQMRNISSVPTSDRNHEDSGIERKTHQETEITSTTMEQTIVALAVEVKVTEEFDNMDNQTMTLYQCQVDTQVEKVPLQDNDSSDSDSLPDGGTFEPADEKQEVIEELNICKKECSNKLDCGTKNTNQVKIRLKSDDEEQQKLLEIKKRAPSNCTCRQIIEKRIEESTCQCEKCKRAFERSNIKRTFVISDTKMDPDGPIPIISDVKVQKRCTCLERYLKRVNRIDHEKEIRRVNEHLIDMDQPFIVNGVAIGPDRMPVYNLSAGVAVKTKCCFKEDPETPDSSKLATIPMGRQKYAISGVQATPEGNVFIISNALPTKPCRCMGMYKEYVKQHDPCLQLYEAYVDKIKCDVEEYMSDLKDRNINEDEESSSSSSIHSDIEDEHEPFEGGPIADADDEPIIQAVDNSRDLGSGGPILDENCFNLDIEFEKVNTSRTGKRVCICQTQGEEPEREPFVDLDQDHSSIMSEYEPTEYERYIILKHIPVDRAAQKDIIKILLAKLAQDGYPLAKLPDCYKLPIFKLWMAKRTYQFWTYEDRLTTLDASKNYWTHILHCLAYRTKNITLGITNTNANNFTWADAKLVKDYTSKRKFSYQRKQRQASVAAAREFFASLFMYENHAKRFRDVYFAYMPSKEEDVFYHNVWKSYDVRNLIMNRQAAKVYRCSKLV